MLDANGRLIEWATIPDAVQRDVPFFIRVREDVTALDADSPAASYHLREIAGMMGQFDHPYLLCDSGGVDRMHLFLKLPPEHVQPTLALAKDCGIDTRPSGDIRPPYALHKLGKTRSLPVASNRIDAFLDPYIPNAVYMGCEHKQRKDPLHFTAMDAVEPFSCPPVFPEDMSVLLEQSGGIDRSAVCQSFVDLAYHRGWTLEEAQEALEGSCVSSKYGVLLLAEVARCWSKVEESDNRETQLTLRRMLDATHDDPNERMRQVKRAFITQAQEAGSLTFFLGYQRLAELAGYRNESGAREYVQRNLQAWVVPVAPAQWFGKGHPDNRETQWRLLA